MVRAGFKQSRRHGTCYSIVFIGKKPDSTEVITPKQPSNGCEMLRRHDRHGYEHRGFFMRVRISTRTNKGLE